MTLQPGQMLSHYRLVEKIGEGGMGAVWVADDTKLHRKVALKILPAEATDDAERTARFQHEARSVAALNHPNIVTLYSVEEDHGIHFLTMEFVEGVTLSESTPRFGFSLGKLLEYAIPLVEAVSAAHDKGIIHRDLKPANVMVGKDGRLRVLDFGLAKLREKHNEDDGTTQFPTRSITQDGRIVGTVSYMSPEQAEGKPVDARSDVFSLGVVLYEMATGRRPFQGDTAVATIAAILRDTPTWITELNPKLPRHLGRIVNRCLAKRPDRRYQTAVDVRNELEGLKEEFGSGDIDGPRVQPGGSRLKKLADGSTEAADRVLDVMVEKEKQRQRKMIEDLKLGGLITTGVGPALMIFLYVLEVGQGVFLVGLIPLLVGAAMLFYALLLAPKPE